MKLPISSLYSIVFGVVVALCMPFAFAHASGSYYQQGNYWCGSYWSVYPCATTYTHPTYDNWRPYHSYQNYNYYNYTYPVSQTTWTTCYGVSSTGYPYTYACQGYPYQTYNDYYYPYHYNNYNYTWGSAPQYQYRYW